jgi:hypothetical protein
MNDRLPGSCWHNPIWYGKWRIYTADTDCPYTFEFVHDDYEGTYDHPRDWRLGWANTVDACKKEIDNLVGEHQ